MIIRTIEFHNILRFFETSMLDLSATRRADSTLALVLAPNDSGKTSLVRGLEFLFYGTVEGKSGDQTLAALVNDEAVRVSKGTSVCGHVQATLASKGMEVTVRRSVLIEHVAKNDRALRRVHLSSLEGDGDRKKWKEDGDDVIAFKLERLMPRSLFHYFFFQGEGLADTLIEKQDPKIREGLTELLHESDWQEAIDDLQALLGNLNNDCRKASGQNQDLERSIERVAMTEERESKMRRELERGEEQLQNAKNEVDRLTALVAESVGKVDNDAAKRLGELRQRLDQHRQRLAGARHGLLANIGHTRGLPFLTRAFEPVRAILQDLREQNLLPADVSEGFVGRILKRAKCICGCDLDEGSQPRKNVERFRASSLSAELNTDLFQLYNLLEQDSVRGFEAEIEQNLKGLETSSEFIASETRDVAKMEEELRVLQARVDEAAQQRCIEILREQRKAADQHAAQSARSRELSIQLNSATRQREQAKKEMNQIRSKSKTGATEPLFEMRDLAGQLIEVLEAGLSSLKSSLHDPLERTIRNLYDPVAKDGSEARISPSTLLPYIEKDGRRATFLGGGQKQVLCLAYIIALAQLRKSLHEALRKAGVLVPAADDQAFVMDSIFGQCEPEYQEAICKFLPGQTGQILLLLAGQQWTETVRRALEKEVDQLFGFEYHSPNVCYDESKHQFAFGKKIHKLLTNSKSGATAYTVIRELPS
jgi:DNA sulfur modification protein DndD